MRMVPETSLPVVVRGFGTVSPQPLARCVVEAKTNVELYVATGRTFKSLCF